MRTPAAAAGRPAYRIIDDLNQDWREQVARLSDAPPEWARRHPELTGCASLTELVTRAARGEDDLLRPLLVEARGGNADAGRMVLQAMLGRLVRMAGRDRQAVVDDYVGAFWCVLARYPLASRPVRIAANLALDTLKAVHRDRYGTTPSRRTLGLPDDALEPLLEQSWGRSTLDHAEDLHRLEAAAVIDAGHRLRLIDEGTRGLLHQVYVEGLSGRDAAARVGSSAGALRVRCSRAVRHLAAHAQELAEAA